MSSPLQMPTHAPYPLTTAGVGGSPTISLDIPICVCFMVLYITGAASHMTILQLNRRRNHKFVFSGMIFGFCMSRIVTCIMRIVWATRPHNIRVAIAAQIFNNAGIILVYILNLIFAFRMLKATLPMEKVKKVLDIALKVLIASIVLVLLGLIFTVVQQFYTLDQYIRSVDHYVQNAATIYNLLIASSSFFIVIAADIIRKEETYKPFGRENWIHQNALLLTTSGLAMVIAGFKAGTGWMTPRPLADPAWYHSKAAFYCFGFMLEIFIVFTFLLARVDRHFYVEDQKIVDPEDVEENGEPKMYTVAVDGTWHAVQRPEVAHLARVDVASDQESLQSVDEEKKDIVSR